LPLEGSASCIAWVIALLATVRKRAKRVRRGGPSLQIDVMAGVNELLSLGDTHVDNGCHEIDKDTPSFGCPPSFSAHVRGGPAGISKETPVGPGESSPTFRASQCSDFLFGHAAEGALHHSTVIPLMRLISAGFATAAFVSFALKVPPTEIKSW